MEYIKSPNLPDRKVNTVLVSPECPEAILHELNINGIQTIMSARNPLLYDITAEHPDMNILHIKGNRFICDKNAAEYYSAQLMCAEVIALNAEIRSPYPLDIALNVAIVGKYAFLNKNNINEQIFEEVNIAGYKLIHVNQGYTKCNIAPICDNAILTEDVSIYKAALAIGMDAMLIRCGHITLSGYAHGFIGGACGKLSSDVLAITGSLKTIPQHADIKAFCRNHGLHVQELSNEPPIDIGSILPLK